MSTSRLNCVLFSDLQPWERHVFETLLPAIGKRLALTVHEVGPNWREMVRELRGGGPVPVWILASRWREAARRMASWLPADIPLHVSALDTRPEPVSLPGLFWRALTPGRDHRFRVLAHNAFAYRTLNEMERIGAGRLRLLPLPLSPSFANRTADFPPRAATLGVLGAFNSDNNLHFALNVAHYIAQHRRDVKVRLIGSGPLGPHLRASIAELGLTDIVDIVETSGPWQGLDLDLLLYTPLRAGHHIPLLMAGAAGIPALCGEVYGIEELIQDGHDGFVLPINETKPTAELALRMLADPALRRFFGGKLREKLSRDFALDHVASLYASHFLPGDSAEAKHEALSQVAA